MCISYYMYVPKLTHLLVRQLVGLWELCSKLRSLFYSEFLSNSLHYAQFCSFYAAPTIIIPHLQFIFMALVIVLILFVFTVPSIIIN